MVSIITLICEYFQYLKNKKKPGEIETFKLIEMLLTGINRNRELFKELIMRAFQYLETSPLKKEGDINYGCKLFDIANESTLVIAMEEEPIVGILSDTFEE